MLRPCRQLTDAHARRIKHRNLADNERLKVTAIALVAERGLSKAWWRGTCLMLRLVLAIREADGQETNPEETLDDLPRFRNAVADVLCHAGPISVGLLAPRRRPRPVVLHKPQRSCQYCDLLGGFRTTCPGCSPWKHQRHLHPVGDCARCGRPDVPLWDEICRACCLHIDQHGPDARSESWTQLWLGGDLAPRLAMRSGALGYAVPHQKARARAVARQPPPPPISPHLVDPRQGVLFDVRRDWGCFTKGTLDQLPSLTPNAQALIADYRRHAAERGMDEQVNRIAAARSLRILLAWLGADAPIHEADILALPADRPGTSARHILAFLQQRGLLTPDPDRQLDIHQRGIEQKLAELPSGIAAELRAWVRVLRGEGRREHRAMSFERIRKYLG